MPGEQQKHQPDDDRRHNFAAEIAGVDQQAEKDEQADLCEPAEPFGEGPGGRAVG